METNQKREVVTGVIDFTPTWVGMLPMILTIMQDAENSESKKTAKDELLRMAEIADKASRFLPELVRANRMLERILHERKNLMHTSLSTELIEVNSVLYNLIEDQKPKTCPTE